MVSRTCVNDMRATGIRADTLAEASCPARARYFGVASRDELLLHRTNTQDGDLY
ncbi:hypothetical protein ACWGCI_27065 [Streptomyces sp. NPDC054949]